MFVLRTLLAPVLRSAVPVVGAAITVAAFLVFGCGARVDLSPAAHADPDPNGATAYGAAVVPCAGPFAELQLPGRALPDLARSSALLCWDDGRGLGGVACWSTPVGVEDNRLIAVCPADAGGHASIRFTVIR